MEEKIKSLRRGASLFVRIPSKGEDVLYVMRNSKRRAQEMNRYARGARRVSKTWECDMVDKLALDVFGFFAGLMIVVDISIVVILLYILLSNGAMTCL